MTEALPLPATALVPIVAFPLLGVLDVEAATAPYANPNIFLFMGGFMIALAMQKWNLHRRIALLVVRAVGTKPNRLVAGFMLSTAFLSMWVSNTATTVLMLPIGLSVLMLILDRAAAHGGDPAAAAAVADAADSGPGGPALSDVIGDDDTRNFATALMLGIAYAASIGSLATLIGTPPNLILAAFVEQNYGIELGFGKWMAMGLPLAAVFLVLAWLVLTRLVFRSGLQEIPGGRRVIQDEIDKLGSMSRGEWTVLAVFVTTALLWVFRQPLAGWEALTSVLPFVANLDDATIAIAAAVALFLIPVSGRRGISALDWQTARQLPWGVLLLFGGGLSLAAAVQESGLDEYIGNQVGQLGALPIVLLVFATALVVILLTEVTSNTATSAAFLPVLGGGRGRPRHRAARPARARGARRDLCVHAPCRDPAERDRVRVGLRHDRPDDARGCSAQRDRRRPHHRSGLPVGGSRARNRVLTSAPNLCQRRLLRSQAIDLHVLVLATFAPGGDARSSRSAAHARATKPSARRGS